jgi:hypothetical protein
LGAGGLGWKQELEEEENGDQGRQVSSRVSRLMKEVPIVHILILR